MTTSRPRRPRKTSPKAEEAPVEAPTPPSESEPVRTQPAESEPVRTQPAESEPVRTQPASRVSILEGYAEDGFVPVTVRVSHDGLYAGDHARVPVSERTAGLIEKGFIDVVPADMAPSVADIR